MFGGNDPMKSLAVLVLLAFPFTLLGCFRERREATAVDTMSAVRFEGATDGAVFTLVRETNMAFQDEPIRDDQVYRVTPGGWEVFVHRDGELRVHRKVFLSDGHTFVIRVP